jgi:hypothetical protein
MARAPSVILTPTQKKEAAINAKLEASKAKTVLAELNKARKALSDAHNKELKAFEAQVDITLKAHADNLRGQAKQKANVLKSHEAALKGQDKLIAAAQKAATMADQKLLALVPPKAVPSPTAAE